MFIVKCYLIAIAVIFLVIGMAVGVCDELIGEFETQVGLIQELVIHDAYDDTIDYVVDEWK